MQSSELFAGWRQWAVVAQVVAAVLYRSRVENTCTASPVVCKPVTVMCPPGALSGNTRAWVSPVKTPIVAK